MNKLVILLFCQFLIVVNIYSQNYQDSLSIALQALVERSDIPGFGVAIVGIDTIFYKKGFGYANVENKTKYTTETIQNIGSMTKTTIAYALMNLVDEKRINLDDDINAYLPFNVKNPHHHKKQITIRQLATHTSSLTDGLDDMTIEKAYLFTDSINFAAQELPDDYYEYFQIYKTNKKISLSRFLHNTYCPDGDWYDHANFLESEPGTQYQYTNLGAALLAFIIEEITDQSFSDYTQTLIFDKLKMKNTFWDLNQIPKEKLASIYMSNGLLIPHFSSITYPDGALFTNIDDISVYLQETIKGRAGNGTLLSDEAYVEMMSNQMVKKHFSKKSFKKSKGILWDVNEDEDNISIDGSDPGIDTYLLFSTHGNIGLIMFKNSNSHGNEQMEDDFYEMRSILFEHIPNIIK